MVDSLAAGLKHAGVKLGDRLALLARNSHAFMALRFAIARANAVLVLRESQVASETDVISHCHSHLSAFKVPKKVVFPG